MLAFLLVVPTLFAAASGDWNLASWLFAASLVPALALGIGVRVPPAQSPLQANEALVVAALAFILAAALMSPVLAASGLPLSDAWFEAVSGVTTTGLTMVTEPENASPAFLFARSWMQWFGGLGIIVLSLALAHGRAADMRRMAGTVSEEEDLGESVRAHARHVVVIYPLLTLAAIAGVWTAGLPLFQAVIHSLSAVSTGGFTGFSDSLAGVSSTVQFTLLMAAFLGALPLSLLHRGHANGWPRLLRDPELRALVGAVLITAFGLWLLGHAGTSDVLVQALSAQTGTGFSTLDVSALNPQEKWVLILSMVTGAGVGSTAGGIKLLRILILIRVVQIALLRVQLPRHAVLEPELGGHELKPEQVQHALVVALLFLLVVLREADPESTDMLFCLTHDDQSNIIGSLVAHSLGFSRVVTKIDDPELEHIWVELGLADSLVPMHTVGRYLADLAEGQDIIELSDILRGDARIFSFTVSDTEARTVEALTLPRNARAICFYRNGNEFNFASPGTQLTPGDEVVVLTRAEELKELRERFGLNKKLDVRVG